jgi:hypothetical protein
MVKTDRKLRAADAEAARFRDNSKKSHTRTVTVTGKVVQSRPE